MASQEVNSVGSLEALKETGGFRLEDQQRLSDLTLPPTLHAIDGVFELRDNPYLASIATGGDFEPRPDKVVLRRNPAVDRCEVDAFLEAVERDAEADGVELEGVAGECPN